MAVDLDSTTMGSEVGWRQSPSVPAGSAADRLWLRWLAPVLQSAPGLLQLRTPLPGCLHAMDAVGWWVALSRHLDGALTKPDLPETDGAADALRTGALGTLAALRFDVAGRAAFLDVANRVRMAAAPGAPPVRPLDLGDFDTLLLALRVAPALQRFGGPAPEMTGDALLDGVRRTLERGALGDDTMMVDGTIAPDALALFAVAGLYAHRDPGLAAALGALLPLPLVKAAVNAIGTGAAGQRGRMRPGEPRTISCAISLDRGLNALFDAASFSGRPLSAADAKRLGLALAGVLDDPGAGA